MRILPPAVTLAVMLWGIEGSSYWRDEAATLAAVRRPFGDLVGMLGNVDAVHGAYYMIIWVVVRLAGSSEAVTRLPSALAMAAAAAGVAAIGRRLVSPRAGLFAGLLFAALPKVSWFGQDARSYAMVAALATAASYLLVRLLDAGGARRRWLAAYAACLAGLGVANVFALLIIPAHGLTLLLAPGRRPGPARAGGLVPAPRGPVPGGSGKDLDPERAPPAGPAPPHDSTSVRGGTPPDGGSPRGGRAMRASRGDAGRPGNAGWPGRCWAAGECGLAGRCWAAGECGLAGRCWAAGECGLAGRCWAAGECGLAGRCWAAGECGPAGRCWPTACWRAGRPRSAWQSRWCAR